MATGCLHKNIYRFIPVYDIGKTYSLVKWFHIIRILVFPQKHTNTHIHLRTHTHIYIYRYWRVRSTQVNSSFMLREFHISGEAFLIPIKDINKRTKKFKNNTNRKKKNKRKIVFHKFFSNSNLIIIIIILLSLALSHTHTHTHTNHIYIYIHIYKYIRVWWV